MARVCLARGALLFQPTSRTRKWILRLMSASPSLKSKALKHLSLLHKALMVFVKHLSSSVCLSEGPNGNHQPRGGHILEVGPVETSPVFTRLRSSRAFSGGSGGVLVKQALGAGLWPRCGAACLPSVVCKLLFRCGWCCDNKLTLWPRVDPGALFWGSAAFLIHFCVAPAERAGAPEGDRESSNFPKVGPGDTQGSLRRSPETQEHALIFTSIYFIQ